MNTLDAEIETARKTVRQREEAGSAHESEIAHAYLRGLLRARSLLFGNDVRSTCRHLVHDRAGSKQVCRVCGDEYPHIEGGT